MKRRTSKGGGGEGDAKTKKKKSPSLPPPPSVESVATRTRGKKEVPATVTWDQPVPIIIHIVSFLDQATLMKVSTVCKQLYQICHGHVSGTTNIVIPVLELSASSENPDFGRADRMVQRLEQHCTKLQHYRKMTITDGHKFRPGSNKLEKFQLNGVVSLHVLSSVATERISGSSLEMMRMLARILPNLREIDLSEMGCTHTILQYFLDRCSSLEKITWSNSSSISFVGANMSSATNLKEIYMDGAQFYYIPTFFLFHKCSSIVLERISIRNARNITQKMLIKFIRKAPPSLRWFRSDLTSANMAMLRLERPEIELLN